jgi:transcriptional regulator with XRE-family HTH domain
MIGMTALKSIHSKDHQKLCGLIRRLREEQEITQLALAERLEVPQSFVSKIETGERRVDLLELKEICVALQIPLRKFVQKFEEELE